MVSLCICDVRSQPIPFTNERMQSMTRQNGASKGMQRRIRVVDDEKPLRKTMS